MPRPRYIRHRTFDRARHSKYFLSWLDAQAVRLATTVTIIFNRLLGGQTGEQIEALSGQYPSNTAAPVVSGTTASGQVLTVSNGTWTGDPAPTFTYQWVKDGSEIPGETTSSYTLVAGDVGSMISAIVVASNSLGDVSAESAEVGPVT